jgi:hypothetical protein
MPDLPRWLRIAAWLLSVLILWSALGALIFGPDIGPGHAVGLRAGLAVALMLAAPAVAFIPLARWMRAPLFEYEGIIGWGALAFIVTFVEPSDPLGFEQFILATVVLTVALATVGTVLAYLAGLRIHVARGQRRDVMRSRRQGYLMALLVVSLLLLHGAGTLAVTSAAMLLVIVVLAEMLAQAYGARGGQMVRSGLGPRRTARRA